MSCTAPYLRLTKLGETALILVYATGADKKVAPYSISGISVKNWKTISADLTKV